MSLFPGSVTAAALTAGSVLLMFQALATRQRKGHALLGALAFGFCTPVWSISANGVWPHTVTGFAIAGMAWTSATGRWWWCGAFGGIALWARPHMAVVAAILGLYLAWRRRDPAIAVKTGAASFAFLAASSAWTHWIYGTWSPTGSYGSSTLVSGAEHYWLDPANQLGMWIAPDRGILVWTPVVFLLLPALARSWRDLPDWSRALLLAGLVYTVLEAELNRFSGGFLFYGYRYGLEFLVCATPALAFSVSRVGQVARKLLGPVLMVQLAAFASGAISDGLWLGLDSVWRTNAFVHAVDTAGVAGWILLALFAGLGVVLGKMVVDHVARPQTTDHVPEASEAASL
jgi:alpha-1,2-mannosyltransferase